MLFTERVVWAKLPKCIPQRGLRGLMKTKKDFHGYRLNSINSSWNKAVRQTHAGIPKATTELVMPVHLLKHLTHNFYDVTASSSHICFIVLFLSVLTGLCKTLLFLVS